MENYTILENLKLIKDTKYENVPLSVKRFRRSSNYLSRCPIVLKKGYLKEKSFFNS